MNINTRIFLQGKVSLKEASRLDNLPKWANCLENRFGKLEKTYIYVLTNYNRKFREDIFQLPYDILKNSKDEIMNKMMFDYYAEIFYYYFLSTTDIIAQVINIYCRIYKEEKSFYLNESFAKLILENDSIKNPVLKFVNAIKGAKDKRNEFAHRFTPNIIDHRSKVIVFEGKESLEMDFANVTPSNKIIENIQDSMISLKNLMQELVKFMK